MDNEELLENIHKGLVDFVKDNYAIDRDLLGVVHDVVEHHTATIRKFMVMMEPVPAGIRQAMTERAGLDMENMAIMAYVGKAILTLLRHQIKHGSIQWNDHAMRRDQILHALESVYEEHKQIQQEIAREGGAEREREAL